MSIKEIENYNQDFASVWAAMDRTEKQMAENAKQIAESNARMDKQIAETNASIKEFLESIKETRKEVKGLSKSYGMHAESYFFESLKKTKQFGGITFDYVDDDLKNTRLMPNGKRLDGQFDIVMENGDSIAIIEVKSRVEKIDVIELVNKKLSNFKNLFLQYTNYKIYLGIAGFAFEKSAEKEALKSGVGILKLSGENIEIQDKHLVVY